MRSDNQTKGRGGKFRRKPDKSPLLIGLLCVAAVLLLALIGLALWGGGSGEETPPGESTLFNPTDSPQSGTQPPDGTTAPEGTGETTRPGVTEQPTGAPETSEPTDPTDKPDPTQPTKAPGKTEPTESSKDPTQPPPTEAPDKTEPQKPPATEPADEELVSGDISCDEFGRFTGQFVEDGRDELVTNVAVVKVTNRSDRFLDFATITLSIDGKAATFVVSGLPAGRSAWVMEINRMTIGTSASFEMVNCISSFRDDVVAESPKVSITANGNMLTATNNSNQTLEDVFVYYRALHTDGNFLGGVTYRVNFGTLEPGQSVEALAGHYKDGSAEIVRIGWKDQ